MLIATATDLFSDEKERMAIIALFQCCDFLATGLAPVFGAFTARYFSWRASFFVLSGPF